MRRLELPIGRRAVVKQFGRTVQEAILAIALEQQLPPLLNELEPWDVVIAVVSSAVGWVDTIMASGQYQHRAKLPYTPGLEYSGFVVWMGPEAKEAMQKKQGGEIQISEIEIGSRVFVDGLTAGPRSDGPYQRWGGCASYAVAPIGAVQPIPDSWSFDQACNFIGSYETAYHCLVECGGLRKGDTVLLHGATGNIGVPACHITLLVGANVIATGRCSEKLDKLKRLCNSGRGNKADQPSFQPLQLRFEEDQDLEKGDGSKSRKRLVSFRKQVKQLTKGGHGVDVVFDPIGGQVSLESMRCCRFGARFIIAGWASTPNVRAGGGKKGKQARKDRPNLLPTNLMMMKGMRVIGAPAVISVQDDRRRVAARRGLQGPGNVWRLEEQKRGFEVSPMRQRRQKALGRWMRQNQLPPPFVCNAWGFDRLKQALGARASGKEIGASVVRLPALHLPEIQAQWPAMLGGSKL